MVARRQPCNPIGWILAAVALIGTVSQNIKLYVVLDYRLHHGALPLGPVAASLTKTGTLAELLVPLAILLFPDGRQPAIQGDQDPSLCGGRDDDISVGRTDQALLGDGIGIVSGAGHDRGRGDGQVLVELELHRDCGSGNSSSRARAAP